jgi:hypothetical protein
MQYSFVPGAPSQPPLFTWESLHYLILGLPPLRPSDSSSDSVVLAQLIRIQHRSDVLRHCDLPRPRNGPDKDFAVAISVSVSTNDEDPFAVRSLQQEKR